MPLSKEILKKQKQERLGEQNYNTFGTLMEIAQYNNSADIWVEFQDEYKAKVHTGYKNFKKGNVRNPYDKTICNIGYIGEGKYKCKIKGKDTEAYKSWVHMIKRNYDPYELNKRPTYIDCYVCEEWLCFQNFAKWFYKNYYEIEGEIMCLDKDVLIKGNKIYSPETCIFVPNRINTLFIKRQNDRGNCLIGVTYSKTNCVYIAYCCSVDKKRRYLGSFDDELDAFYCYKNFKEKTIKQVADEYKDLIPQKLYEALYRYEVEIND